MSKRLLEYGLLALLLCGVFFFWSMVFPGHLSTWYWSNFFSTEGSFFLEYLEEKDLLMYVSNFLVLFFKWTYSGALLMASSLLAVSLLCRKLLKKLRFSPSTYALALMPAVLLFVFQANRLFIFRRTLFVIFLLIFVYTYISKIEKVKVHSVIAVLLFFVSFWFFNNVELVYFYAVCCVVELLLSKSKTKYIFSAIALSLATYFFIDFLAVMDSTPEFKNPFAFQLLFFPLFIALLIVFSKFSFVQAAKHDFVWIIASLLFSGLFYFSFFDREKDAQLYENLFCYNKLLLSEDYDEMLKLGESEKKRTTELFPFVVYAHAKKGDLPDHLFDYPIDSKTIFLPKALPASSVQTSTLGIFFNHDLGFVNEAIHQTFLMSTSHSNGETLFAMRYLSQFQVEKNDSLLAEKYLEKLDRTIVNRKVVEVLRNQLKQSSKEEIIYHDSLLHINSQQENNLRIAYLSNPENVFVRDVFFCSLLQRREYNMFCAFCAEYIKENQVLPVLYQEALLMAQEMGISSLSDRRFFISDEVRRSWQEFAAIFNNPTDYRSMELQLRKYRRTWWYYCMMSNETLN